MNRKTIVAVVLAFGGLTALPIGHAAEPSETEVRLQALEDHVQIEQLLMRYATDGQWLFSRRVVLTDMNKQWEP